MNRCNVVIIATVVGTLVPAWAHATGDGATLLQESLAALKDGRVNESVGKARDAVQADPDLREAWEIIAAWETAASQGEMETDSRNPDVWKALKRLPASPPPAEKPSTTPPAAGQLCYVMATTMRVRGAPKVPSPIVAEVFINTPMTVKKILGDWAEVHAQVPGASILAFGAAPKARPSVEVDGFVQWKFLTPAMLTKDMLVAEATELEKAGNAVDAARRLERALFLDPDDRDLRRNLMRMATTAKLHDVAVRSAMPLREASIRHGDPWSNRHPGNLFFGCIGQPEIASSVDEGGLDTRKVAKDVPNACITGVDARGPCEPKDDSCDHTEGAACEREKRQFAMHHAKWEKEQAKHSARMTSVKTVFAGKPHARFLLNGTADPDRRAKKVFAYLLPYTMRTCTDTEYKYEMQRLQISANSVDLPAVGSMAPMWIELPQYQDALVGLVEASSAEEARKIVEGMKGADMFTPALHGPRPNLSLQWGGCFCG